MISLYRMMKIIITIGLQKVVRRITSHRICSIINEKTQWRIILAVLCLLCCAELSFAQKDPVANAGDLVQGFINPPQSARPGVWWLWLDGNITNEGITRDLEEMSRQGIGRVLIYDLGGWRDKRTEKGPADFLGIQWRALFKHAVTEASRLGIEVNVENCSGWNCGGPWITVENTNQKLIWSEQQVTGPGKFDKVLPTPGPLVDKYYRSVAVLAFREPDTVYTRSNGPASATQSSTSYRLDAERAIDGNTNGSWGHASLTYTGSNDLQPWWQLDLGKDAVIDEIEIWRRNDAGMINDQLNNAEVIVLDSQKKVLWKKNLGIVINPSIRIKVEISDATQTDPKEYTAAKARYIRIERKGLLSIAEVLVFSEGRNIAIGKQSGQKRIQDWEAKALRISTGHPVQFRSGPGAQSFEAPDVQPGSLVDLSAKTSADGRLAWDVPPGNWRIIWFGHTAQGVKTHGSTSAGTGYEVDPFNSEAMAIHFAALANKLIEEAGPQSGKTLRNFFIDSYEAGAANWTARFRDEFQRRRGYDLLPYLPVLTGRIVHNPDASDRFLWDYRRTIADLYADNYYGQAARLFNSRGIGFQAETYGGCFDILQCFGRTDTPCGEFWSGVSRPPDSLTPFSAPMDGSTRAAASAGHIYGKRVIIADGFINYDKWQTYPFVLKAYGDRAFCEGVNSINSTAYAHQPKLDGKPGLCPLWGVITDRNITWWGQSHAFWNYLARCSYLLQQGQYVADVCYYRGEGIPYWMCIEPALIPTGYSYDEFNAETLLTRMSVKDGKIVLPDGMSYRLLVLPDETHMTPHILRKIAELVEAGATVVGSRPVQSPSLTDYPACDAKVRGLADKVWGACDGRDVKEHVFGKGKVVWGKSMQSLLLSDGIKPDFEFISSQKDSAIRFIHRHAQDADIYFVANQRNRYEDIMGTFRVSGKAPELWMPDTGKIASPAVYDEVEGRTRLSLRLDPLGSVFVVFRRTATDNIVSLSRNGDKIFPGVQTFKSTPVIELLQGENATVDLNIWESGKYELRTSTGQSMQVQTENISSPLKVAGPWDLSFPAGYGAPASVVLNNLISWTKHADAGVKYFSGTAIYRREIELRPELVSKDKALYLDLGDVKYVAEVRFNDVDLGVLWKPPFRVELSSLAKPGRNILEVNVTNLWPNRLIGDQFLPENQRIASTTDKSYTKKSPLIESGLLGPVTIYIVERKRFVTK